MPSLSDHAISQITKMILIGDSGTGKTSALASLVEAGYKLRILEFDSGLSALIQEMKRRKIDASSVGYIPLRDEYKMAATAITATSKAFPAAMKYLDRWEDDTNPAEWGKDHILVLDSLTRFSDAAFNWAKAMNPSSKDPRQWYGAAQAAIEDTLAKLTSESFATNVIVISHVSWLERSDGTTKGYPSTVGKALSPKVASYFDNLALMETRGSGDNVRRTLRTAPTALIDLKNPASFSMAKELPIDTGLATFFETVRA